MEQRAKIGLALYGGGSRGALEVGFYRALAEFGIRVDAIAGTSIGAVNGAMIAAGIPPKRMAELWAKIQFSDLFSFNWRLLREPRGVRALYRTDKLRRFLHEHLPVRRFEELRIPLTIISTDLQSGGSVLWDHGDLIEAILGSIALPGLFPPVTYEGTQVVDGGFASETPLGVLSSQEADIILVMFTGCRRRLESPLESFLTILSRSFEILLESRCWRDIEIFHKRECLVVLDPCVEFDVSLLDFSRSVQLMELGYQYAREKLAHFPYCEVQR